MYRIIWNNLIGNYLFIHLVAQEVTEKIVVQCLNSIDAKQFPTASHRKKLLFYKTLNEHSWNGKGMFWLSYENQFNLQISILNVLSIFQWKTQKRFSSSINCVCIKIKYYNFRFLYSIVVFKQSVSKRLN